MNSAPLSTNFCPDVPTKPVDTGAEAELLADVDVEETVEVEEMVEVGLLEVAELETVAPGMHCE